jgi:hypothetical protein
MSDSPRGPEAVPAGGAKYDGLADWYDAYVQGPLQDADPEHVARWLDPGRDSASTPGAGRVCTSKL